MSQHLFTNVNVLDCTDGELFAGEVRVEGNEITAIARMAKHSIVTARKYMTAKAT